jgi:hypothetical protein
MGGENKWRPEAKKSLQPLERFVGNRPTLSVGREIDFAHLRTERCALLYNNHRAKNLKISERYRIFTLKFFL